MNGLSICSSCSFFSKCCDNLDAMGTTLTVNWLSYEALPTIFDCVLSFHSFASATCVGIFAWTNVSYAIPLAYWPFELLSFFSQSLIQLRGLISLIYKLLHLSWCGEYTTKWCYDDCKISPRCLQGHAWKRESRKIVTHWKYWSLLPLVLNTFNCIHPNFKWWFGPCNFIFPNHCCPKSYYKSVIGYF